MVAAFAAPLVGVMTGALSGVVKQGIMGDDPGPQAMVGSLGKVRNQIGSQLGKQEPTRFSSLSQIQPIPFVTTPSQTRRYLGTDEYNV